MVIIFQELNPTETTDAKDSKVEAKENGSTNGQAEVTGNHSRLHSPAAGNHTRTLVENQAVNHQKIQSPIKASQRAVVPNHRIEKEEDSDSEDSGEENTSRETVLPLGPPIGPIGKLRYFY